MKMHYNYNRYNRNIHENIFLKVLCISNYMLLFSALCPVRWNVENYHNSA